MSLRREVDRRSGLYGTKKGSNMRFGGAARLTRSEDGTGKVSKAEQVYTTGNALLQSHFGWPDA
jgi:hypothetical protein